ncbi:DMT family transporter [Chitinophaga nivalis]|uniref:EamA family transporter n=1 Tax=Chitinophaga nivalis TaxID=2991709 RepID=A0ABT3IWM0_9BACT|nr:EamA family transporter [Chitinophaga nivalis]MCW3461942.1 EamA family transporter [Chitinophaga nivalis]MCW3488367.1 EamA family transporter [Chitinophaga nivalis]
MPTKPKKSFYWGFTMVLLSAVCFSMKAIFIKLIYRAAPVDAITVLALRMLFALPFYVLTALVLWRQEGNQQLSGRQWLTIGILGVLGYYLSGILDFMGLQYITAGMERLILFLYPTFALLMSAMFFGKRITTIQWQALLLAYIGIVIAFVGDIGHLNTGAHLVLGCLLVAGCAVAYAFYMVGGAEIILQVGAMKFTAYALIFSTLGVFTHYLLQYGFQPRHFSSYTISMSVCLAVISTVLPTFLLSAGMKYVGAGNAAIIGIVGPVATILLAMFFLQESVSWPQLLGTVLVLAGVWLIGKKKTATERS